MKLKITLFALALLCLNPNFSKAQDFFVHNIKQVVYPPSQGYQFPPEIMIDFSYVPDPNPYYVHIYVVNPQGTLPPIDLLQPNFFCPDFTNERFLHMPIDLSQRNNIYLPNQPIDTFRIGLAFSDTLIPLQQLEDPFFVNNNVNFLPTYQVVPYEVNYGYSGFQTSFIPNLIPPLFPIPPNTVKIGDTTRSVIRGCSVPNIDLDSLRNNKGTDSTYAGDWNACAPASCANSFEWLEARHPLDINTGLSHREKLKEFSKLMKRLRSEGATTQEIVEAKLAYIDKYRLPVSVSFQSMDLNDSCMNSPDSSFRTRHKAKNRRKMGSKVDFNYLFEQMKCGADVEFLTRTSIVHKCPGRPDSVENFYHALTLVDIKQSGSTHRIHLKDDYKQQDTGGVEENTLSWDTTSAGWPYLKEWSSSVNLPGGKKRIKTTWVWGAIAEKLDTTVKFEINSITRLKEKAAFKIVGNPSEAGYFDLEFGEMVSAGSEVQLLDVQGRFIKSVIIDERTNQFAWREKLASGTYLVRLISGETSSTQKLIVN